MGSTEEERGRGGTLYFAYGSNLSPTQMHSRCPLSTPIGLAHLPGWKWIINKRGYANIVQCQTTSPTPTLASQMNVSGNDDSEKNVEAIFTGREGAYGVLYRLHPDDEATLDACEGVPWAYERRFLDVTLARSPASTITTIDEVEDNVIFQDTEQAQTACVLVYIDFKRDSPGIPKGEYIGRMNRGIQEAMTDWGLPKSYVDAVMRPFIPGTQ
ncbi:hypothetical protein F5Y04DRAFT_233827 [Hypomontagnella monticulosa]|nr:hypothetical protein F5Y04DRAFT_233827 [Hypomontagnella monticulosa]